MNDHNSEEIEEIDPEDLEIQEYDEAIEEPSDQILCEYALELGFDIVKFPDSKSLAYEAWKYKLPINWKKAIYRKTGEVLYINLDDKTIHSISPGEEDAIRKYKDIEERKNKKGKNTLLAPIPPKGKNEIKENSTKTKENHNQINNITNSNNIEKEKKSNQISNNQSFNYNNNTETNINTSIAKNQNNNIISKPTPKNELFNKKSLYQEILIKQFEQKKLEIQNENQENYNEININKIKNEYTKKLEQTRQNNISSYNLYTTTRKLQFENNYKNEIILYISSIKKESKNKEIEYTNLINSLKEKKDNKLINIIKIKNELKQKDKEIDYRINSIRNLIDEKNNIDMKNMKAKYDNLLKEYINKENEIFQNEIKLLDKQDKKENFSSIHNNEIVNKILYEYEESLKLENVNNKEIINDELKRLKNEKIEKFSKDIKIEYEKKINNVLEDINSLKVLSNKIEYKLKIPNNYEEEICQKVINLIDNENNIKILINENLNKLFNTFINQEDYLLINEELYISLKKKYYIIYSKNSILINLYRHNIFYQKILFLINKSIQKYFLYSDDELKYDENVINSISKSISNSIFSYIDKLKGDNNTIKNISILDKEKFIDNIRLIISSNSKTFQVINKNNDVQQVQGKSKSNSNFNNTELSKEIDRLIRKGNIKDSVKEYNPNKINKINNFESQSDDINENNRKTIESIDNKENKEYINDIKEILVYLKISEEKIINEENLNQKYNKDIYSINKMCDIHMKKGILNRIKKRMESLIHSLNENNQMSKVNLYIFNEIQLIKSDIRKLDTFDNEENLVFESRFPKSDYFINRMKMTNSYM